MSDTILPLHSRPSRFSYDFRRLKSVPSRIFYPCDPGVASVRSFKITPKYDIKLEDVLQGKHLPPLGLKEFEEYLLFVEHSAENLYFWMWLSKYEEMYSALEQDEPESVSDMDEGYVDDDVDQRQELRVSYARGRATFLIRGGPMELNLPSTTFNSVPTPPMPSAEHEEPVHPRELARAKQQVTDMLRASFSDFIKSHSANSGRHRGFFALFAGLVFCAIGLAPIMLAFKAGYGRFLTFAAFPCLWLGVTTIIAGLHGVCIVIYLFGDARQLHPYELVAPSEGELRAARGEKTVDSNWTRCHDGPHHVHVLGDGKITEKHAGRRDSTGSDCVSSDKPKVSMVDLSYFDAPIDIRLITPYLARPSGNMSPVSGSPTSSNFTWEIESSSASITEKRTKAGSLRGVFAPMAEALSPIVRRSQWTIIMRSATIGLIVAPLVCGLCTLRL